MHTGKLRQKYISCQSVYFLQKTKVRKTLYKVSIILYCFSIVYFFLILFKSTEKSLEKCTIQSPIMSHISKSLYLFYCHIVFNPLPNLHTCSQLSSEYVKNLKYLKTSIEDLKNFLLISMREIQKEISICFKKKQWSRHISIIKTKCSFVE